MRAPIVALALALAGSGCVHVAPEEKKAYVAPIGAVPEIVKAATAFRLAHSRWPETKEELFEGFQHWKAQPEFLTEVRSVSIIEHSTSSVLYRFIFHGGGSSEVRVNLDVKRPNQALQPTPMLVTPRAYARVAPSTGVADL